MSQLIQMRQRIKAIETIKKIAHAMRLISMSAHLQLKGKEQALITYLQATSNLLARIQSTVNSWKNPFVEERATTPHLFIIIGSQKGLCGTFNETLFKYIEMHPFTHPYRIITVGKRATEYFEKVDPKAILASYNQLTIKNCPSLTQLLAEAIIWAKKPFSGVTIISNKPISFFVQKPSITQLFPLPAAYNSSHATPESYEEKQDITAILTSLTEQYIEATLYMALFQSLLAEHSARFISMDSSTRNARDLLETTKLEYNKARQAKITKELTELIGSFTS